MEKCPRGVLRFTLALVVVAMLGAGVAHAQTSKPNIVVIMGDDIGWFNTSVYNHGLMGYQTPNIDRIAHEGMMFTDAYGQQSCTAGRAAFLMGQSPKRTGLLKIGMPGDPFGINKADPTIAELLKSVGYATGQFGKNHLGDRDEHLPINHGFDEFFGNLYHLNAEEEPENVDYPKDPAFRKRFGPRGVLRATAGGKIEDTGPLTMKRMETIDEEFLAAGLDFVTRQAKSGKPFFMWFNTTRTHIYTHLKPGSAGKTGRGIYADGMVEHDGHVGQVLAKLDQLGLSQNTIVIYTTDNGAEKFTWPDGGVSPFRGEKATTWEGGIRIPLLVRWPGKVAANKVSNEIISLEDMLPTLLAAAGQPDITSKLLAGTSIGGASYKVHLDGYNFLPYLTGQAEKGPRKEFFAWVDDGTLGAMRYGDYKANFSTQNEHGMNAWLIAQQPRKAPMLIDLRADPFEDAPEQSNFYGEWLNRHMYALVPLQELVAAHMATYKDFPARTGGGSFTPKQ
jgi:arylsulfatase